MILRELLDPVYIVLIPDAKAEEFKRAAFKSNMRAKAQTHGPKGKYREVDGEKFYSLVGTPGDAARLAKALPADLAKILNRSISNSKVRDTDSMVD